MVPFFEWLAVSNRSPRVTKALFRDFQVRPVHIVFQLCGLSYPVIVDFLGYFKQWTEDLGYTVGFEPAYKRRNFEVSNVRWFHYTKGLMYWIQVCRELRSV